MAYQRLFEFVKSKCERLAESNASAAEDIEPTLQAAIRALRKLPTYLHQCLDLVVNSRRSQLVRTAKGLVNLSLGIAIDSSILMLSYSISISGGALGSQPRSSSITPFDALAYTIHHTNNKPYISIFQPYPKSLLNCYCYCYCY